jgi:thiol:disulfide interchange protein DsbD
MLHAAILLIGLFVAGQAAIAQENRKVELSLMSETATVHPGQTLRLAVKQTIAPGWHTYWINPGDAGEPMVLDWSLPDGFRAGAIEWPLPEAIPVSSLTNYGYTGEAVFLVTLTVPEALSGERVELSVNCLLYTSRAHET